MTQKDFQLIAQAIRDTDMSRQMEGTPASIMRRTFAETFADALALTNPRFKRDLFIQAATGVVPVNARKAREVFYCEECGRDLNKLHTADCSLGNED